jgi:tRNA1Val (adenine37-N6)-methyltransferase
MDQPQWVKPGERVDDLQFGGLSIIQNPTAFCFGMDAVLLADFCSIRSKDKAADLGTGTGILPLLMAGRADMAIIHGFEIQKDMAYMAQRSVMMNGLDQRIFIHEEDLRNAPRILAPGSLNLVVSNPPYGKAGGALLNPKEELRLARHEGGITLAEVVYTAKVLLNNGGRLAVVFPAPRLLELMDTMRLHKMEPKRLRMVHSKLGKAPHLVLVEGVKSARPMLHCLPPLIVYDGQGNPTPELNRIYHRDDIKASV